VYGNYDVYEAVRASREGTGLRRQESAKGRTAGGREATAEYGKAGASPAKPVKRKRQFPYRKVEDLEAEIATHETKVAELEAAIASPGLYRDANQVKETMRTFEETKAKLQQLYAHWEEAVELN
jgi:ATP-binding cassette subfamily F protein 3